MALESFSGLSRKPGEWQTFDIVFHNGVIMHNRQEITGRAPRAKVGTYAPHGPEEPLQLQNHGSKVRFRNIWVRKL